MKPEQYLPLRPVEFQILVSLAEGERHGYAIRQAMRERGEGGAVPGFATLYRALLRLEDADLIVRAEGDEPTSDDERRRVYGMTALGRAVMGAEARRLAPLVEIAGRSAS